MKTALLSLLALGMIFGIIPFILVILASKHILLFIGLIITALTLIAKELI